MVCQVNPLVHEAASRESKGFHRIVFILVGIMFPMAPSKPILPLFWIVVTSVTLLYLFWMSLNTHYNFSSLRPLSYLGAYFAFLFFRTSLQPLLLAPDYESLISVASGVSISFIIVNYANCFGVTQSLKWGLVIGALLNIFLYFDLVDLGFNPYSYWDETVKGEGRFHGFAMNPNLLGFYVLVAFYHLQTLDYFKQRGIVRKCIFWVLATTLLFLSVATESKKVFLVLILAMFLVIFIIFSKLKRMQIAFLLPSFLLLILLAMSLGDVILDLPILERCRQFFAFFSGAQVDTSTSERSSLLLGAKELILESPIWGWGSGFFLQKHGLYTHSTYAELLCSGGIIGLLLYGWPFLILVKKLLICKISITNLYLILVCIVFSIFAVIIADKIFLITFFILWNQYETFNKERGDVKNQL